MASDSVLLPNIFNHATSELSQDAILAYILSWAKPDYRESHPKLNEIGEKLLRAMFEAAVAGTSKPPSRDLNKIERLEVKTQLNHIDVWVKINDDMCLIIEDKTATMEHSNQIREYLKAEKERLGDSVSILALYVKTGNETQRSVLKKDYCGKFFRMDILKAISEGASCGNTLIEEFVTHLQAWQAETESYEHKPVVEKWSWRAREGFYMAIENWLPVNCDVSWGSVPRRSGGFLGLWWHWRSLESERCKLYLQIEDGWRLQIRVSDVKNDQGHPEKSNASLLHRVRRKINDVAKSDTFKAMKVNKSGRYRGGNHSAVVDITFEDSVETYIAVTQGGAIDMPRTKERLELAMKLVDIVCNDK